MIIILYIYLALIVWFGFGFVTLILGTLYCRLYDDLPFCDEDEVSQVMFLGPVALLIYGLCMLGELSNRIEFTTKILLFVNKISDLVVKDKSE
jgi:hypothetical protein